MPDLCRLQAAGADEGVAEDTLVPQDAISRVLAGIEELAAAVLLPDRHVD